MLNSIDPRGIKGIDKKAIKDENEVLIEEIAALQKVLFAEEKTQHFNSPSRARCIWKRWNSGVQFFSGINPLGCQVHSFKKTDRRRVCT